MKCEGRDQDGVYKCIIHAKYAVAYIRKIDGDPALDYLCKEHMDQFGHENDPSLFIARDLPRRID